MKREEIIELVNGTAEAAFVLDPHGMIAAWNSTAADLFGVKPENAVGRYCSDVLHGIDECGRECSADCAVKGHSLRRDPMRSYDIMTDTAKGRRWCSMTVIAPGKGGTAEGYTLHLAKSADLQKRFEHLMRDFVVSETSLPAANVEELVTLKRTVTEMSELSARELEVLRQLAKGSSTNEIAAQLFISPTTVNNHVQRILKKLSAHTRLEAVRRAEKARLI
ncbi:MAG TPA: LuxR C-terminal-related transcriptional regulator [Pyrinomonadaceae bacterium]|nr:LuxR C-terminal-related transcriptional regulator [Pyrinomonadaceae bacterium]